LTDGRIYISDQGEFMKAFDAKDGFGIKRILPMAGIIPAIITGRNSIITERRCKEIGIEFIFQGIEDKFEILQVLLNRLSLLPEESAFIGDDLNDYSAMKTCGYRACPADAVREIQKVSDYISPQRAGYGAVRDIIEHIIKMQRQWNEILKRMCVR
jgi:3-deoxy-D-manno-octulosonate 8-phosphate phosphatase (KDO 8-P phosphatase)